MDILGKWNEFLSLQRHPCDWEYLEIWKRFSLLQLQRALLKRRHCQETLNRDQWTLILNWLLRTYMNDDQERREAIFQNKIKNMPYSYHQNISKSSRDDLSMDSFVNTGLSNGSVKIIHQSLIVKKSKHKYINNLWGTRKQSDFILAVF